MKSAMPCPAHLCNLLPAVSCYFHWLLCKEFIHNDMQWPFMSGIKFSQNSCSGSENSVSSSETVAHSGFKQRKYKQVSRCFKQLNLSCQSLSADLRQNLLKRSKKKNFAKKPKKYHLRRPDLDPVDLRAESNKLSSAHWVHIPAAIWHPEYPELKMLRWSARSR